MQFYFETGESKKRIKLKIFKCREVRGRSPLNEI